MNFKELKTFDTVYEFKEPASTFLGGFNQNRDTEVCTYSTHFLN